MSIIERIDELIAEAENEPSWTAMQALRCLRKELLKEQSTVEKVAMRRKDPERIAHAITEVCSQKGISGNVF